MYQNFAQALTSPELAAHRVIHAADQLSENPHYVDLATMLGTLREQARAANEGDFKHAEAMLMNQATALQSLFARLTERAMGAEYLSHFQAYMRLGLRAQSQCRATLEALSEVKNPLVVYARQANVTTGPQQVNNGIPAPPRGREIQTERDQLSGASHELLPHSRASGDESRIDPALEALGEIHRAEVPRG
jgi:hypothetical protein